MYTLVELHQLLVITHPALTLQEVIDAASGLTRKTYHGQPGKIGYPGEARITHKGAETVAAALGITL